MAARTTLLRLTPLALAIALGFSLATPAHAAAVTNCEDSGAGSLREAIRVADNGETIDLGALACSTITLSGGAIFVGQNDLSLRGPGAGILRIDAGRQNQALVHTGTGTLSLSDLTVANGFKYQNLPQAPRARGGCIFSSGTVALVGAELTSCEARSSLGDDGPLGGALYAQGGARLWNSFVHDNAARSSAINRTTGGGGIYTAGRLQIAHSVISGNVAETPDNNGYSFGGGAQAGAGLEVKYSTISDNSAVFGGGLRADGDITISSSTLSGNSAGFAGAADLRGGGSAPIAIVNSTVSGNRGRFGAGLRIMGGAARIANSTIAFNIESGQNKYGGGLRMWESQVELQSTLIAGNTNATVGGPTDIGGNGENSSVSGSHNLIGYSDLGGPSDTIFVADPRLAPLALNGGSTRTHALLADSLALDRGANTDGLSRDQRGQPRSLGGAPDIGAFERDPDRIFADGFD